MVKTGYISFAMESGGGYDALGNPLPVSITLSDRIACNLNVITREYKLYIEQQYVQIAYVCTMDRILVDVLGLNIPTVVQVHIYDAEGNSLGLHHIQSLEYLNLVRQIKISV